MDRFQELMEKWKYRAWTSTPAADAEEAIYLCIEDLRDTLLLIEADKVLQGGK